MRLLLDTHIVLAISERRRFAKRIDSVSVTSGANDCHVSVATLWEIAIKERIGKLRPAVAASDLATFLEIAGIGILDINRHHAIESVTPEPFTNDPFDRMLLAQCKVEGLRLVTFDRALVVHPLAWRPTA